MYTAIQVPIDLQAIDALRSFDLSRKIIFLQYLLVLCFEKSETSTGLGKYEQTHLKYAFLLMFVGAGKRYPIS